MESTTVAGSRGWTKGDDHERKQSQGETKTIETEEGIEVNGKREDKQIK